MHIIVIYVVYTVVKHYNSEENECIYAMYKT